MGAYLIMVLIMFLVFFCIMQYRKTLLIRRQVEYIANKIVSIVQNETQESIMIVTEYYEIKHIVNSINYLLDYSYQNKMAYKKSRISTMKLLSNISHDLKTPLTVLMGYAEVLNIKYSQEEKIKKVKLKVNEVLELINKFFDLVKLESGDKILNIQRVNICEVCRKNMFEFYEFIISKNINTEINIPENPIYVMADVEALDRILRNLIDNAIKYGIDGKYIGVNIRKSKNMVIINIEDHGKGVSNKYKNDIFERTYTMEDSRSKEYQGSGLGLTISKELVEYMGGKIELFSIPYEKTIFSVFLKTCN